MNNSPCVCAILSCLGHRPVFAEPQAFWSWDHKSALLAFGRSCLQVHFNTLQDAHSIEIAKGSVSWFTKSKPGRMIIYDETEHRLAVYNQEEKSITLKYQKCAYKFILQESPSEYTIPTYGIPCGLADPLRTEEDVEAEKAAIDYIKGMYYEL